MASPSLAVPADTVQLRQFVQWLAAVAFAFAGASVVAAIDLHNTANATGALVNVGFGCCLILVGHIRGGGRLAAAAALVVATGFLTTALAISIVLPDGVTALAVLPMLAVAVTLRSSDRRVLLWLLLVGAAAGLLVGILADVTLRQSASPDPGAGLLGVSGQVMAVLLVVYALWQFSGLLHQSLARVRETNERLQVAEGDLRLANDGLRRHVSLLESRNREMTRLVELGELLSTCQTSDEVAAVISRVVPPLFDGDAGAYYELGGGGTSMESVAAWGDPPPTRRGFSTSDCWALRRGRVHVMDGSSSELRCPHVEEATPDGAICAPLAPQGESRGVLPPGPADRSGLGARRLARRPRAPDADARRAARAVARELPVTRELARAIRSRSGDGPVQSPLHGGVAGPRASAGRS